MSVMEAEHEVMKLIVGVVGDFPRVKGMKVVTVSRVQPFLQICYTGIIFVLIIRDDCYIWQVTHGSHSFKGVGKLSNL